MQVFGADKAIEVDQIKGISYYSGPDAADFRHRLDLYLPKGRRSFSGSKSETTSR